MSEHDLLETQNSTLKNQIKQLEREAQEEKIRVEEKFRDLVEKTLGTLKNKINGYPEDSVHKLEQIEKKLDEKIDACLKIKEEQMPPWLKKILIIAVSAVAVSTGGLFTAWLKFSEFGRIMSLLSEQLPTLFELIEKAPK